MRGRSQLEEGHLARICTAHERGWPMHDHQSAPMHQRLQPHRYHSVITRFVRRPSLPLCWYVRARPKSASFTVPWASAWGRYDL